MSTPAAVSADSYAKNSVRLEPAKLGLLLFIAMEAMFFTGLLSAFVVFRFSPMPWPPAGQPRLPVEATAINTFFLVISGFTFYWAFEALRENRQAAFRVLLGTTAFLGALFLAIQGTEWIRLLHYGLTASSSVFGGFFYALIGLHGLHVLGGLVALTWVTVRARRGLYQPGNLLGVDLCRTYWFFVVGLWPVLFVLVYL